VPAKCQTTKARSLQKNDSRSNSYRLLGARSSRARYRLQLRSYRQFFLHFSMRGSARGAIYFARGIVTEGQDPASRIRGILGAR
jgi:hypothetical protein